MSKAVPQQWFYENGVANKAITVGIKDRGLNYGDGFFDTMLFKLSSDSSQSVMDGILLLAQHHQRWLESCQCLKFNGEQLLNCIQKALSDFAQTITAQEKQLGPSHFIIKLIVTRGEGERGYRFNDGNQQCLISFKRFDLPPSDLPANPLSLTVCEHPLSRNPKLAGLKHLNRLDQVMARNEWQDQFDEGIMFNIEQQPVEATASNLYWAKNGKVFTSSLKNEGVNGVVRRWLINENLVEEIDLQSAEGKSLDLQVILDSDEVFLSNGIKGIQPVGSIHQNTETGQKAITQFKQFDISAKLQHLFYGAF